MTGYEVFHEQVHGTQIGPRIPRHPPITHPSPASVKLNGLRRSAKFRTTIQATTRLDSDFSVRFRPKGGGIFDATSMKEQNDFTIVRCLEPSTSYEFRVVSVNGKHQTSSEIVSSSALGVPCKLSINLIFIITLSLGGLSALIERLFQRNFPMLSYNLLCLPTLDVSLPVRPVAVACHFHEWY